MDRYPEITAAIDWWDTEGKEQHRLGDYGAVRDADANNYDRARDERLERLTEMAERELQD